MRDEYTMEELIGFHGRPVLEISTDKISESDMILGWKRIDFAIFANINVPEKDITYMRLNGRGKYTHSSEDRYLIKSLLNMLEWRPNDE